VAHAETEVGSIDILVNNSGVSTTQRMQDVTEEDYDFIFDTNVRGAFFVAQEVGKRMLARAAARRRAPSPADASSTSRRWPACKVLPQIGVYCDEQGRRGADDQGMALEWGRFGINVNALCPGYIDTEINHHHWTPSRARSWCNMLPRKRVGKPEDLDG
jgi:NAD(P)-dependent dehydrogenase (short-subunit alcohol dehydrogenase family)